MEHQVEKYAMTWTFFRMLLGSLDGSHPFTDSFVPADRPLALLEAGLALQRSWFACRPQAGIIDQEW
jgi:hypothetical protein